MKLRLFSKLTFFLTAFALLIAVVSPSKVFAYIDLMGGYSGLFQRGCVTANNSSTLALPEIIYPGAGDNRAIVFVTWRTGDGSTPDLDGELAQTSVTRVGPSPTDLNSASWVTTNSGFMTITFNGTFDEAVACVVTVNGVTDVTAHTASGYELSNSFTEITPANDRQLLMFSGTILGIENPNIAPQADTALLSYSGNTVITEGTLSVATAYATRQDYNTIGLDYNFNNADNTDYANIIYEVDYAIDFVSGTSSVVGDTYSFDGVADSSSFQGGFFNISAVYYELTGASSQSGQITPDDGVADENIEELTLNLAGLTAGNYTITMYAIGDDFGTLVYSGLYTYDFTVGAANLPTITLDSGPNSNSFISGSFTASDLDGDVITRAYYKINAGAEIDLTPGDGSFDESTEEFNYNAGIFADGDYTLVLGVENDIAEITEETYNFTIDNNNNPANCVLSNIASPNSDNTPTHTVSCTSPDGIYMMQTRYYHNVLGELQGWTNITTLSTGAYGDQTVAASITSPVTIQDGSATVQVRAYTLTGKVQDEPNIPIDGFTIEAVDNTAPTAKLNPILPNPLVDNTPYLTGACLDTHTYDTNSNMAAMYYRLNGGSWVSLPALDGAFNSPSERFSIELPPQSIATHTVDLRCVDAAGNDTNIALQNASRDFTVLAPSSVSASEVTIADTFDNQDFADLIDTSLVWGNGIIRLKETISAEVTVVNTQNYEPRYSETLAMSYPTYQTADGAIWHAQRQSVALHYPSNGGTSVYNIPEITYEVYGLNAFTHNGDNHLVLVSSGLYIYNFGTSTHTPVNIPGLDNFAYQARQVVRDTRDGRLGFYVHNVNSFGTSNIYYWDLNNTPQDFSDDTFEWLETTLDADLGDITYIESDLENANTLYLASSGVGVVIYNDNNTPLNNGDDTMSQITNADVGSFDITTVGQLAFDPQTKEIYFVTVNSQGSQVFVWDYAQTPSDKTDDTVERIGDERDLLGQSVYKIKFVEGPQYIGGQLFMSTYRGDLLYYNTNGSATNSNDDTIIFLPVANGLYPEMIGGLEIVDYDTLIVNFQRQGLARINLTRGWATSGTASTIELPPEDRLVVNNIRISELQNLGALSAAGGVVPNVTNSGITTQATVDGGVEYNSLNLNQLLYVDQTDYRFRLNINLTPVAGRTPILGGFTVIYASYQDQTQSEDPELEIEVPVTNLQVNSPFALALEVQDPLGYTIQNYNGTVDLTLQRFEDGVPAPYLNYVSANIVSGRANISDATITNAGEYRVLASNIQLAANSPKLTVLAPVNNITPRMTFYSDRYVIDPGESVTLYWTTSGLDTVSLTSFGAVQTSGNRVVSPTQNTYYILNGSNSEGDNLAAGLQIIVRGTGNAGNTEDQTEEDGEFTSGENGEIDLKVTPEQITVVPGARVDISWEATNAEDVFIDYTNNTGSAVGNIQVYPESDLVITITARGSNGESVSKQIRINVQAPGADNESAENSGATTLDGLAPFGFGILSVFTVAAINGGVTNYVAIFLGALIWRKRKYWGIVFDLNTFKPLALVTIRIYKKGLTTKTLVAQTITDLEGKYGVNITEAGTYIIEFVREGYASLAKEITITSGSDILADAALKPIQMQDAGFWQNLRYSWKQNAPAITQILRLIVLAFMVWGLSITWAVIGFTPSVANYLVAALYLVFIALQSWAILEPIFGKKSGAVLDTSNNRPINGAIIRLIDPEERATENLAISNADGIVKIRAKAGNYNYLASKAGYQTSNGSTFINEAGKLSKPIGLSKSENTEVVQKFGTI